MGRQGIVEYVEFGGMSMALSTSTVASQRGRERLLKVNHIWILFAKTCYCQNLCEVNSYRQQKFGQEAQEKEHN